MKYIVIITFAVALLHSLFQGVFILITDPELTKLNSADIRNIFSFAFYFSAVIFAFPILVSVIVFKFVLKRYIAHGNILLRSLLQSVLIMLIVHGGVLCWTILDMQYLDFNYTYTRKNILSHYKEAYLGYLPVSLLIPVLILFIDKRFFRKVGYPVAK